MSQGLPSARQNATAMTDAETCLRTILGGTVQTGTTRAEGITMIVGPTTMVRPAYCSIADCRSETQAFPVPVVLVAPAS